MADRTKPALAQETACSVLRPPNTTATRIFRCPDAISPDAISPDATLPDVTSSNVTSPNETSRSRSG